MAESSTTMAEMFTSQTISAPVERIVRPAEVIKLRPDYPDALNKAPPPPKSNVVVWGSAGQDVFALQASASQSINNKWPETSRTYDVVRVYNPDDRDQHIDTEVMTEYQGRNKISQDRIQIRFAETKNTANTEVISRGNSRSVPNS
jgi:hypothetical protein